MSSPAPLTNVTRVLLREFHPTCSIVAASEIGNRGRERISLIHYGFVSWLQDGLLSSDLHPALKGAAVFAGALALSWATVSALRRIPRSHG